MNGQKRRRPDAVAAVGTGHNRSSSQQRTPQEVGDALGAIHAVGSFR